MPVLTTEIILFEANDAFRSNLDLPIPAFQLVLQAAGAHAPVYYGKQIEEPGTWGFIFLNWDSYEAHKEVMDAPTYPAVIAGLAPALADNAKLDMYHVLFSAPTIALEKPVTEVAILTLKSPENRAAVVEILSRISEATEKMLVFGQTREDENKYVLIGGWPSVEVHLENAARPEAVAILDKLYSLATKDHHYHTKLSQYFREIEGESVVSRQT